MKTMLALAALAGALSVAPAMAQNPSHDTQTRVVSYTDLDLRTDRGQAALDRRLHVAVNAACGTASSADPEGKREIQRCRVETFERATTQRDQIVAAALGGSPTTLAAK